MNTTEIQKLSAKIDNLLGIHNDLREQNKALRAAEVSWQAERVKLLQQNEVARLKIKEMIERLKKLEQPND